MSNEIKVPGRITQWLWRQVDRHQRRPRWQRLLIQILWIVGGTAAVYFWVTIWDCLIC